jgi:sulfur carrier protein ThiS
MRIHLAGHLAWYEPQKRAWLELRGVGPIGLLDLLRRLGVPDAEVAVAVVNGRALELEAATAKEGDKVEFFPPIGGG